MAAPLGRVYSRCILCGKFNKHFRYRRFGWNRRNFSETVQQTATQDVPTADSAQPWQPVIGLEIHAQIQADTKLFSRAPSKFGAPVNTQVQLLDMALPGTLPVINKRCVEAGILTALALNCTINEVSRFDRKHYFYADLPAGYQITQQHNAIANNGLFTYILYGRTHSDCVEKTARITQLQLEQDSGKSLHDDIENQSLIDLNRAGCALMEIVTEPDFYSADEARSFVRDLRRTLMLLRTCDGKMAEGSLRVDANISVSKKGYPLGVRTEVKNLNSLNIVHRSITYEIKRQIKVLEKGGKVVNETRSFDQNTGQTVPMRDKEVKQDYRFMPEPNLPPLHVSRTRSTASQSPMVVVDELQQHLPQLPSTLRAQLMSEFDCSLFQAGFIVNEGVNDLFISLAREMNSDKFRNFFIYQVLNIIIMLEYEPESCQIPAETIGRLYKWYGDGDVGRSSMTKVIEILMNEPSSDPKELLDKHNLWLINDDVVLRGICEQVLESAPAKSAIKKYKKGQHKEAMNKLLTLAGKATVQKGNVLKMSTIFKELLLDKRES